jgi:hypothetical protein
LPRIYLGPDTGKLNQYDPISPRGGKASILVQGIKKGTRIEVLDENRTVKAQEGYFEDYFEPLQEHIYKFELKKKKRFIFF